MLCRCFAFAIILFSRSLVTANDGSECPVFVVFDSNGATPDAKLEFIRLVNEFCPAGYGRSVDDALIARIRDVFHKFDDPAGFDAVGGVAYSLSRNGGLGVSQFRTVKSKETFEAFLALHAAKRGDAVEVIRDGDQVIMKDSSAGETRASGAVVRWTDAYFAFSKNVVAWGATAAYIQRRLIDCLRSVARRMAMAGVSTPLQVKFRPNTEQSFSI